MTPVFIINMPQDAERRALMQAQIDSLPEFRCTFIEGVDSRTLPETACVALAGPSGPLYRGRLGCFLSHVRAWELIARQTGTPFAVVLEDDTGLSELRKLALIEFPANFDIIFINDRMSPNFTAQPVGLVDMATALRHLDVRKGTGTDGYLLTPTGAKKLLAATGKDLYAGHIDGRLLRYASTEADIASLGPESFTATVLRHHHDKARLPQLGLLNAYVTSVPLVKHMWFESVRDTADTATTPPITPPAPAIVPAKAPLLPGEFSFFFPALEKSWVDHARNQPATQSSVSPWSVGRTPEADAARAVSGRPEAPYAFHTAADESPWWQVDLGAPRPVRYIIITNRSDNPRHARRATPLCATMSQDGINWSPIFTTPAGMTFGEDKRSLVWTGLIEPRYIRLTGPYKTCLHLSQVQIFGPPDLSVL